MKNNTKYVPVLTKKNINISKCPLSGQSDHSYEYNIADMFDRARAV